MNLHDDSPLDDMTDESIPTSLPLAAAEAMCAQYEIRHLMKSNNPRADLSNDAKWYITPPDWLIAGLNCKDDEMILPICIHSYLMDWRPK